MHDGRYRPARLHALPGLNRYCDACLASLVPCLNETFPCYSQVPMADWANAHGDSAAGRSSMLDAATTGVIVTPNGQNDRARPTLKWDV
jgi:hypothetical protein